ncbi:hypothetical protein [Halobacterium jilantaiense]|uniref:hypothetical protein n=1 Tax=Halobacterium jilantaiense TaxID=355548 RepID=UPI00115F8CCB|nr:hypothetical protein [Halobacterium jilantaiense]
MPESKEQTQNDDVLPSQKRRSVSEHNQFQLPAAFVTEVGFQSSRTDTARGAKVAWYYHEKHDKAVLGSDTVDRPSLELVGACRLAGVSNDALAAGDVDGARVTIISELPDSVYERLTRGEVVLKPVYTGGSAELDATCVSVYPAREYDHGLLPNVDRELREVEDGGGTEQVESIHHHTNSI